jgi:uncharacterized protein (DUF983 family)
MTTSPIPPQDGADNPLMAGVLGKCPRCGTGNLFDGYLTLRPSCPSCGLDYGFADAGDGPGAFVILIVGFVVVGAALWLEVNYSPPLWVHFTLWTPLVVIFGLVALRIIKGLLIVFQYRNRAAEGRIDRGDER